VIAVGRLSAEKGHAKLLEAFQPLAARFPDWELVIHGEGSERPRLEQLAAHLGVGERVTLPGWSKDVESVLREADLFVLPSRYEGFPNALLEAMAAGVASISFDCDSGPREIIRNGIDGLLVPPGDVTALTQAMASLMSDEANRRQLASQARSVVERFGQGEVYRRWDEILDAD
jgi:glycosyltransferase involved in cell wall biosynthesis